MRWPGRPATILPVTNECDEQGHRIQGGYVGRHFGSGRATWPAAVAVFGGRFSRSTRRAGAREAAPARHVTPGTRREIRGFGTLHRPDRGRQRQRLDRAVAADRSRGELRLIAREAGAQQWERSFWRPRFTHVPSLMLSEAATPNSSAIISPPAARARSTSSFTSARDRCVPATGRRDGEPGP